MRLEFLCQAERKQLHEAPHSARALWLERLSLLLASRDLPATPYWVRMAGSALEAGSIYLRACEQPQQSDVENFLTTATKLIALLSCLSETRLAMIVFSGVDSLLKERALATLV